ncbi:cytochrome protein [Paramyrothecium foliicola]|nr:cytochrome protein [Paramyrothecium foliicola]
MEAKRVDQSQESSLFDYDGRTVLKGLVIGFIIYKCAVVVYRLYFSPLAKFPGPKIVAASSLYEVIVDLWKNDFHERLRLMHEKYGPIVRCSPGELSINDPEFYNQVYVPAGTRRTDLMCQRSGLGLDGAFLTTPDHFLHQQRRKPVEKFFAFKNIKDMEPAIHEKMRILDRRISEFVGTGSFVRLDHAYAAMIGDLILKFTVGEPSGMLEDPNFTPGWFNMIRGVTLSVPIVRNFPLVGMLVNLIPMDRIKSNNRLLSGLKIWTMKMGRGKIEQIKTQLAVEEKQGIHEIPEDSSVFRHILQSDMPDPEKHVSRLSGEALVILGAGTVTTATAITMMTYKILNNKTMHKRLTEDLREVTACYPDRIPSTAEFQQCHYLVACIKEALRIFCQVRASTRVSPDVDLHYNGYVIPKKTPVGMAIYQLHRNAEAFPEPFEFNPDRWLGEITPLMNKSYVPFAKGSRDCVGRYLAHAELLVMIGILFRPGGPYDNEMAFACNDSDMELSREGEFSFPAWSSRGLGVQLGRPTAK